MPTTLSTVGTLKINIRANRIDNLEMVYCPHLLTPDT